MKKLSVALIAVFLAVLTGILHPVQVFAESLPDYVSEVKVFYGDYTAAKAEGYTLLKDGNDPVDLNRKAGGGLGSKGEKAVYLGYKTTKNSKEAITDLALMNMKGGYRTKDYEFLMERQMNAQIIPFVESFSAAIEEYRENYNSDNEGNKQRAEYIHDRLNKLLDDDCGGAGLGDLLLNETKYEMGDAAYNALSDKEKQKHADILTIMAQSSGYATLLMESLLARATDNNDTTWVDRFCSLTYDDLVEATGMAPTDAEKELDKLYSDGANTILDMWDTFREQLLSADESEAKLNGADLAMSNENSKALKDFSLDNSGDDAIGALAKAVAEAEVDTEVFTNRLTDVLVKAYLTNTEYGDGTLYDFFTMTREEAEDRMEEIYTLVSSFTKGQRAVLEFVSLSDLVVIAGTEPGEYSDENFDTFEEMSIYDGVNRDIYKKGGVALTSDAIRASFEEQALNEETSSFPIHWWTFVSGGLALSSAAAFGVSLSKYFGYTNKINELKNVIAQGSRAIKDAETALYEFGKSGVQAMRQYYSTGGATGITLMEYDAIMHKMGVQVENLRVIQKETRKVLTPEIERLSAKSNMCKYLSIGFSVAIVVLSAVTVYLTWQDLKAYYNVNMTPMPNFIIDEKDLIGYNKKGEKIVLKNQSAYYKLAECNRGANDEFYSVLGTGADMNGDVGKQWLALYTVKKDLMQPILASSLKVVTDSVEVPAGYTTGIHMFGSDAAFNLNSSLYDWNDSAPSVYVYFQTDDTAANTTGSVFTGGTLALAGSAGIALGAVVTALAMTLKRKSDKKKAATV